MARPVKCRWVGTEPNVTAFKPCGVPLRALETVELRLDELEAVRLADLDGLYQDAAAERMGVSRATFGRLITSARLKIASALLGPKLLCFKGGSIKLRAMRKFACTGCAASFEAAQGTRRPQRCPACRSESGCPGKAGSGIICPASLCGKAACRTSRRGTCRTRRMKVNQQQGDAS